MQKNKSSVLPAMTREIGVIFENKRPLYLKINNFDLVILMHSLLHCFGTNAFLMDWCSLVEHPLRFSLSIACVPSNNHCLGMRLQRNM